MKHARPDYDRIQDPDGLIPEGEPVFLIRGKDVAGPATVRTWARYAEEAGAGLDIINAAYRQATAMENWQKKHEKQVPDL
jgi:hypothetical protein